LKPYKKKDARQTEICRAGWWCEAGGLSRVINPVAGSKGERTVPFQGEAVNRKKDCLTDSLKKTIRDGYG
jgi:hypothetical protein